ncbi:hypothetical protein N9R15_02265 [Flavobacteriaceae bacterium]|nr:hypothetical protein [Flavobacteriaceae bacterium]
MKKGLLSLLAVALTIVSCQNYDDQFAELTDLVNTLSTDVEGLTQVQTDLASVKATVNGLVTAISAIPTTDNSTALTDVLAKLVLAQADIDAIELILAGGVASADDLAAIDTLIDAVQDGVNTLLTKNAAITVNIIINDTDTLATAAEYIEIGELSPAGYLLSGTLNVDHTNLTAAQITEANILTAKIISVSSAVTVNGAVDLSGLSYIGGKYSIVGAVAPLDDTISSLGGDLDVDGEQGVISFPNLTSIVGDVEVTSLVASVTSIDLSSVTVVGAGKTFQSGNSSPFTALETANFGSYVMTTVSNPLATSITLGQKTTSAALNITAPKATTIDVNVMTDNAHAVTVVSAASTAVIHFDALKTASAVVSNTGSVLEFHLPALTETDNALNLNAATVNLSGLKKVLAGGAITLVDNVAVLTTSAFVSAVEPITFTTTGPAHVDFSSLVLSASGALSLTASTTQVTVASTSDATLARMGVLSANTALKTANVTAQSTSVSLTAQANQLTTLNFTGKISAAAAVSLEIDNTAAALKTIVVADVDNLELITSAVVTATTSGAINDVVLTTGGATLKSVTIGHGPHAYTNYPAQKFEATGNTALKAVDLSTVVLLDEATITGNTALAVITAPAATGALLSNAIVNLTINSNSLTATGTVAVPGTNLADVTQASLTTWKAYVLHVQTTIGATDAQVDAAAPASVANPIAIALDYDLNGAGGAGKFRSDYGGTEVIDTVAELNYIDQY